MYWQEQWRIPIIAEAITRDRYFQIRCSLKVIFDNDIPENDRGKDRLWKVRPFLEKIKDGCMSQSRSLHISVDEMMVPFQGNCGLKQYIRGKPNPVGIKVFVLANPDGTVCDFVCYQGKTTFPEEFSGHGVSNASVLMLTRSLLPGHILYHDRFFTSVKLADELLEKGFGSTGTIMTNRIPKVVRTKSDKDMQREGRGSNDMLVRNDQKLSVVKWMDNKSVLMLSSVHGIEPTDRCRRWSKKEKKHPDVQKPSAVRNYNSNMGGVDMADRLNSYCPMRARTKKWTVRILCHFTDVAVSNSWLQYKEDQKKANIRPNKILQLRSFKMMLGQQLLNKKKTNRPTNNEPQQEESEEELEAGPVKRRKPLPLPSPAFRKQAIHLPEIVATKTFQKCRRENCKKLCRARCVTCKVFLCLNAQRNCFADFHRS